MFHTGWKGSFLPPRDIRLFMTDSRKASVLYWRYKTGPFGRGAAAGANQSLGAEDRRVSVTALRWSIRFSETLGHRPIDDRQASTVRMLQACGTPPDSFARVDTVGACLPGGINLYIRFKVVEPCGTLGSAGCLCNTFITFNHFAASARWRKVTRM